MNKLVINKCYGGFSLSKRALNALALITKEMEKTMEPKQSSPPVKPGGFFETRIRAWAKEYAEARGQTLFYWSIYNHEGLIKKARRLVNIARYPINPLSAACTYKWICDAFCAEIPDWTGPDFDELMAAIDELESAS